MVTTNSICKYIPFRSKQRRLLMTMMIINVMAKTTKDPATIPPIIPEDTPGSLLPGK